MQIYLMSLEERKSLIAHHTSFQAAIAVVANRKLKSPTQPKAIRKNEGGVVVGFRDVAILEKGVEVVDFHGFLPARVPEEVVTVEAINEIMTDIRQQGPDLVLKPYRSIKLGGNPLNAMLLKFKS